MGGRVSAAWLAAAFMALLGGAAQATGLSPATPLAPTQIAVELNNVTVSAAPGTFSLGGLTTVVATGSDSSLSLDLQAPAAGPSDFGLASVELTYQAVVAPVAAAPVGVSIPVDVTYALSIQSVVNPGGNAAPFVSLFAGAPNGGPGGLVNASLSDSGYSSETEATGVATSMFTAVVGTPFSVELFASGTIYAAGDESLATVDPTFAIDPSFSSTDPTYAADYGFAFSSLGAPEPGAWALMLAGLAALGAAVRRRRALVLGVAIAALGATAHAGVGVGPTTPLSAPVYTVGASDLTHYFLGQIQTPLDTQTGGATYAYQAPGVTVMGAGGADPTLSLSLQNRPTCGNGCANEVGALLSYQAEVVAAPGAPATPGGIPLDIVGTLSVLDGYQNPAGQQGYHPSSAEVAIIDLSQIADAEKSVSLKGSDYFSVDTTDAIPAWGALGSYPLQVTNPSLEVQPGDILQIELLLFATTYTTNDISQASVDPTLSIDPVFAGVDPNYASDFSVATSRFSAAPEPGAWILTLLGAAGLGLVLRAARRSRAVLAGAGACGLSGR